MSSRTSRVAKDILFTLRILISFAAWVVDHAQSFPKIVHLFAPDHVALV